MEEKTEENMKIELELMDWKNAEEEAVKLIRANMQSLKINKKILELCRKEIAKFTDGV